MNFPSTLIPTIAHAVAYNNWLDNRFHYARIERDPAGNPNGLSQTDANLSNHPTHGNGLFTSFHINQPTVEISRRGVQRFVRLENLLKFVEYCDQHYDISVGQFYFCYFD